MKSKITPLRLDHREQLIEYQPRWVKNLTYASYALITMVIMGRFVSFYDSTALSAYKVTLVLSGAIAIPLAWRNRESLLKWYVGFIFVALIGVLQCMTLPHVSEYTVFAFSGYVLVSWFYVASINSWEGLLRYADCMLLAGVGIALFVGFYYDAGWSPGTKIGKISIVGFELGANNNELAFTFSTAVMAGLLAINITNKMRSISMNALRWAAIVLCLYMVLKTGSRGIGGACFAALAVNVIGLLFRPGTKLVYKLAIGAAILIGLGVIISADFLFDMPILERLRGSREVGAAVTSDLSRMSMITTAWVLFTENPLLGVGFDGFRQLSGFETYSHNEYVELLCNIGFIGFACYFLALGQLYYKLLKSTRGSLLSWAIGIVIFISVSQLTLVIYYMLEFWLFIPIAIVLCRLSMRRFTPKPMVAFPYVRVSRNF